MVFRGHVDPEAGAKLAALMGPLAKPTSGTHPRTTADRQGDAFAVIIELAATSRVIHHGDWTVTMVEGRAVFEHQWTKTG